MQGKKPTLKQKKLLKARGLNPENWLVISDDRQQMTVIHRHSLKPKTIIREEIYHESVHQKNRDR